MTEHFRNGIDVQPTKKKVHVCILIHNCMRAGARTREREAEKEIRVMRVIIGYMHSSLVLSLLNYSSHTDQNLPK